MSDRSREVVPAGGCIGKAGGESTREYVDSLGARPLTADSSELGRQSKMRAQPSGSRVDMISSPKGSGGRIAKLCEPSFSRVTNVDLEPSLAREFPNAMSVQVEDLAPW